MTEDQKYNALSRPEQASEHPSRRTTLLRAAADGELTAAGEQELRAHLAARPDDRAVVAFEQQLRKSIASAALGHPAPQLKERIQHLCAGARARESSPLSVQTAAPRCHWQTAWLAIAASVALVAGIAYLTVRWPHALPAPGELITPTHRVSLVSFVSSQHEECELHADMIGSKLRIDSLGKAPAAFREVLGREPDLGRLAQSGLRFMGAGPCAVPGRGRSVHMVFDAGADPARREGGRTALVSIFVQQDSGELAIEPGRTYRLVPNEGPSSTAAAEIYVWKTNGFIYFLSSTSGPALETARLALGAGAPSGTL